MESINDVLSWLTDHESAFSAIAALVVIFGVVLSPLGAGLRGLLSGRGNSKQNEVSTSEATETKETNTPATQDFLNTPPPLITDKPSIAVLPFLNMSKDEDKEFFADGMTEDIITGLSCDSRLFVIARNSTFAYKGQSPDIRTVGKELGVRYVLEGSIRPINDRLRITAQLIETETGSHIWADKIDRPTADIFDIQDEVVDSLVSTLCASVGTAEGQRVRRQIPESLKAWELCVRAEMVWIGQLNPAALGDATSLTLKASQVEPGYGLGWALLGYFTSLRIVYVVSDNVDDDITQSISFITKAVALAPEDPVVLGYAGWATIYVGQASTGVGYLERSLEINPNSGVFRQAYAMGLSMTSRTTEALRQFDLYFRQSPKDPSIGRAYGFRSGALVVSGNYSEADKSAALAIKHAPSWPYAHLCRGMSLAGLGREREARQAMQQGRQMAPQWTQEKLEESFEHSYEIPQDAEKLKSLLRQAWED